MGSVHSRRQTRNLGIIIKWQVLHCKYFIAKNLRGKKIQQAVNTDSSYEEKHEEEKDLKNYPKHSASPSWNDHVWLSGHFKKKLCDCWENMYRAEASDQMYRFSTHWRDEKFCNDQFNHLISIHWAFRCKLFKSHWLFITPTYYDSKSYFNFVNVPIIMGLAVCLYKVIISNYCKFYDHTAIVFLLSELALCKH